MPLTTFTVHTAADAAGLAPSEKLGPFDARCLDTQRPDAHLAVTESDKVVARCSLWWTAAPELPERKAGAIGHFAAADSDAAKRVLDEAFARLRHEGCDTAVGPMDGNTWRKYRFVTERGTEPPFFLEPDNPDTYPDYFRQSGFAPLAEYYSALTDDLAVVDPRLPDLERRADESQVQIRPLDLSRPQEELKRLYGIVLESFKRNYLYTPIDEAEFLAQYTPVLPLVRPELVMFAERDGECIGFVFALPDVLQQKRGVPMDTVIVKTMGVLPDRQNAGLGGLLLARCHAAAYELGFRKAIHALMYESNVSRMLSSRYARTIRRYTLFSKDLRS